MFSQQLVRVGVGKAGAKPLATMSLQDIEHIFEWITMDHRTKGLVSITDAQQSGAPTPARRSHARHISVLRVGKLVLNGLEQLCLVRNISASGLMAQIYAPRKVGDQVTIELRTGQIVTGKVVWTQDGRAGVQFDKPIDTSSLLAGISDVNVSRWVARQPRLSIPICARLEKPNDLVFAADVRDISQGGTKIASAGRLKPEDQVVITIDGLDPIAGMVRWCHGQYAGIAFNKPIPLTKLAIWAIEQEGSPSKSDAASESF